MSEKDVGYVHRILQLVPSYLSKHFAPVVRLLHEVDDVFDPRRNVLNALANLLQESVDMPATKWEYNQVKSAHHTLHSMYKYSVTLSAHPTFVTALLMGR